MNDSSENPWVRIASSVRGFFNRPLIEASTLEAMRTQGRFLLFLGVATAT